MGKGRRMAPAATLQAFAHELKRRRLEKGWNQSELARQAWGKEGSATRRDVISGYEKGANMPGPENLQALARALGCKPEHLVPQDARGEELKVYPLGDGKARLYVNQVMDRRSANAIMQILKKLKSMSDYGQA